MTTFKLFFNQNDIRRITKQVTSYEDFVTFLEELYPQFHMELLIKYDDKEGDRIAVTSQIEWDEMMEELRDEKIIKLYITEGPNPRGYFKDGPKPESLHFYTNEGTKEPSFDENILKMLDENVTKCLGTFFRDGKIIPSGLPTFLRDVIGVKYNKENEVDMDVNISELGNVLHRKALDCMASLDKEVIQKGREYMNALVNLDPTNCLSLYNLACAEALLNRVPQALETLEKAIRNGYDNLEHMLEDKDFDNIRNSEGFVKLIELIGELQSSFVDEEDVDCENCNCEEECNNEHCGKIEGEKDCCDGTDNNCCGLLDNGCDEPVVLEYDSFQDSQFVIEKDVEESQKIETQVEPKVENKPTIEKSVEQLNNQLSESFIDLRSKWSAQITNLKNLGFTVDDEVLSLLIEQTNGNVEEVVSLLLSNN